ncbi:hypothetical protein [uncultured Phocaeicola sp.]|uniref:hypothetical protein n=1 Tax=uncultured Phocaeicola sp. TaxID=990718 RepID=UPI00322017F9
MITLVQPIAPLINAEYPGINSDWLDKLRNIIAVVNESIQNINDLQDQAGQHDDKLADLISQVNSLLESIVTINSRLDGHDTAIADINSNLDSLQLIVTDVQNNIDAVNDRMDEINISIDEINAEITKLNNNIDTINTALADHKSLIVDLQAHNADQDSKIELNRTDINNIIIRVDDHQTALVGLQDAVVTIANQVNTINTLLAGLRSDLDNVSDQVRENIKDIDSLDDRLETLRQTVGIQGNTITAMQNSISHLQDDIATLNGRVDSNTQDVAVIKTTVNAINLTLTAMQDNIHTLQDQQAAMQSTLDAVNTIVANHDTQITNLLADVSAIKKDNIQINQRLDALETAVARKLDASVFDGGSAGQVWTAGDGTEHPTSGYWFTPPLAPEVRTRLEALENTTESQGLEIMEVQEELKNKLDASVFDGGSAGQVWTSTANAVTGAWADAGVPQDVDNRISANATAIAGIESQITTINEDVNKKLDASVFDGGSAGQVWTSTANAVTGAWADAGVPQDVDNRISANATAIAGIESQITTINEDVNKKLDASVFDGGSAGQVWTSTANAVTGAWADASVPQDVADRIDDNSSFLELLVPQVNELETLTAPLKQPVNGRVLTGQGTQYNWLPPQYVGYPISLAETRVGTTQLGIPGVIMQVKISAMWGGVTYDATSFMVCAMSGIGTVTIFCGYAAVMLQITLVSAGEAVSTRKTIIAGTPPDNDFTITVLGYRSIV